MTELYNPKAFLTHAALLRQAFAHCAIFPTAASRRSLDRVSVPVWRIVLSDPLDIDAMVGHYPTIKLMSRRPIFQRMHCKEASFLVIYSSFNYSCGISSDFSELSPTTGQIPMHYSPVRHSTATSSLAEITPKGSFVEITASCFRSTCMC